MASSFCLWRTSIVPAVVLVSSPGWNECQQQRRIQNESAKWRAPHAHVRYVPYVPTRPTCPTCPPAQVYFTERKIKRWKFCTHTFLRVLSLILDLNFRNYRFIQTGWLSLFTGTHRRKIPNRVFLLQQTYFLLQ